MVRVRWLGVTGRLSAGIDDNDTSISSAGLADLPVITAPDYAVLILDPGATAGTPEVVYVTAHTASATTATISRGEETGEGGSVGRTHASNTYWVNGPTPADYTRHVADSTELDALIGVPGELVWQDDTSELYIFVDGATPTWDLVYPVADRGGIDDFRTFVDYFGPDEGYDYEFGGEAVASLPSGWSWYNQGASTYLEGLGAGVLSSPSVGSEQHRAIVRAVPSGNWEAYTKITSSNCNSNYSWFGFFITDGTKIIFLRIPNDSAGSGHVSSYNTATGSGGAGVASNLGREDAWYFRVRKNSTSSYDFFMSVDGVTWRTIHSAYDMSAFMTPTHFGFGVGSTTGARDVACHWFRVR